MCVCLCVKSQVVDFKPVDDQPPSYSSLSVLRYKRQLLDQRIAKYQAKMKPEKLKALQIRGQNIDKQAAEIRQQLRRGGVTALKGL